MRGQEFYLKTKKVLSAVLALSMIAAMTACGEKSTVDDELEEGEVYYTVESSFPYVEEEVSSDTAKSGSFRLSIAGDYIIYDSMYTEASFNAKGDGYDFSPMVENLRQFTSDCDLNYYNQETILGGAELGVSSYPTFNSPQEAGDAMVALGYNLVSTATNHSLDGGKEALLSSYEYWKNQENVFMTGTFDSQKSHDEVRIMECNGITYTMLDYTYSTNGIPVPEGEEYLVNVWPTNLDINDPETDAEYQSYKGQVRKDIEAVRDKVDFLIVCIHAGVEYAPEPSAYQKDMARFLADNGVNLVIGTHPHVIEPAEFIGDTLVYYSMGNLLCSQMQDDFYNKVTSILATMTVRKVEENGETKIVFEDLNNELLYSYYNPITLSGYCVVPFSSQQIKEYLPEYKEVYKTYRNVFRSIDPSLPFARCAE